MLRNTLSLAVVVLCSCTAFVDLDGLRGYGDGGGASDATTTPDATGDGPCIPRTCESLGLDCGPVSDGCGAFIKKNGADSCGSCSNGLICGAVKDNVCGSPPLYAGVHSEKDCKDAAGLVRGIGVVGDAGGPQTLCEITGNKCPAGWTRLQNWGSTAPKSAGPCGCNAATCTTGFHPFGNVATESCSAGCKSLNNGNCAFSAPPEVANATVLTVGCY